MSRVEDARLLTGAGRFLEDLLPAGTLHAHMVRAPLPHGRIGSIDVDAARAAPGVHAVLSAGDVAGAGPLEPRTAVTSRDGSPMRYPPRPLMAADEVRHAGEVVAMVVADTAALARDAAERVVVEMEEAPACTDARASSERCFDWERGDAAAVAAAFAGVARVVALDDRINRIAVSPIETRGALGLFEDAPGGGRYTLHTQSQGVHLLRTVLAEDVLRVDPERLRVVTGDVGGSFGMKIMAYPEQGLVLLAARRLGRPVRWVGERGDAFLSDNHARDHWSRAEVALDGDGRFLALRCT